LKRLSCDAFSLMFSGTSSTRPFSLMNQALPERIRPEMTALKRVGPMRLSSSGINRLPLTVPPR
jgi:hypothetical protein